MKLFTILLISSFFAAPAFCESRHPCDDIKTILPRIEAIRELRHSKKFQCRELSEASYRELTSRINQKNSTAEGLKFEEIIWKKLGIIPERYPYLKCALAAGGDDTYAFYDIASKTIVLRQDQPTRPSIIAHELVHMLQDQIYDRKKVGAIIKSSQQALAVEALIEGDAMQAEEKYAEKYSSEEGPAEKIAPGESECSPEEPLKSILLFPYEWGSLFVSKIVEQRGIKILHRALKSPPRTVREILYPEEFLKGEFPPLVHLVPLIYRPKTSKLLYQDSLGEYVLRALLKSVSSMSEGVLAAKGLTFDQAELIDLGNNTQRVSWNLLFETPKRLDKFRAAIEKLILKVAGVRIEGNAFGWEASSSTGETWAFECRKAQCELTIDFAARG